jgi:dTDP-4-amino-4,6-dideoxygalactose transaminase
MLPAWTRARRERAAEYRRALVQAPVVVPPECDPGHVYHLFPVLARDRDAFIAHLAAAGVGTLVHYPLAIPRQAAMAPLAPRQCPVADRVASQVVSLPLRPLLTSSEIATVAAAVHAWRPSPSGVTS